LQTFEIPQKRQSILWKKLAEKEPEFGKARKTQGGPLLFRHLYFAGAPVSRG
jgi:hypothetical protein